MKDYMSREYDVREEIFIRASESDGLEKILNYRQRGSEKRVRREWNVVKMEEEEEENIYLLALISSYFANNSKENNPSRIN
jgi:hypothetical protein